VGDQILVAAASGIHANGLSLARKLAGELPAGYATPVPDDARGRCLGEVLLDPTPLYGPLVEALQRENVDLHYAVHVTGHGWRKLMRAPQALSYIVDRIVQVPPVLRYLQQALGMDDAEAYGTFNMGAGYALFVGEGDVVRAQEVAKALERELLLVGRVEAGPRRVVVRPLELSFDGSSLQIR
jgi:phosphoribosylformylglycinamidine cyclo-ligase